MSEEYYFETPPWGFGSTYAVTSDPPDYDPVEALRQVVEEITGVSVIRTSRKIGFY